MLFLNNVKANNIEIIAGIIKLLGPNKRRQTTDAPKPINAGI